MPATKRLVLDLPAEQVDMIEARVTAGEYASASAFVSARIADEDALPIEHEDFDWDSLSAELDEQERRIEAGEEELIPAEEVFARLDLHLAELRRAEAARQAAE